VTTGGSTRDNFEVAVNFGRERVTLRLRGEVDLLTAPELEATVNAIIDQGPRSLVLDLADLAFMDASGLRVIASGVSRLKTIGEELTIRSAPALVTRLLNITGLSDLIHFEKPEPVPDRLGPEGSIGRLPAQINPGGSDPYSQLRRVIAIPADLDVVDGALRLVVALARATVEGADGVSVSLERHGRLTTVAATDQIILEMDSDQYATGEGPCLDAYAEGRWFHVESLAAETRWPSFIPRARELGINAILSNPLLTAERPVGAINIYSRTRSAFSEKEQELAAVIASEASNILQSAGVDVSDDLPTERFRDALESRQVIARAEGVLMERDGVSAEDAFSALRNFSRHINRPLVEWAGDIVDSTQRRQEDLTTQSERAP
jgi:anti-anti-sigma factor